MAEYIEREAARPDAFCVGVSCQDCPFLKDHLYGGCKVDDYIKSIPAADVVPVRHGRWMLIEYPYGQKTYLCSECKDDGWWNGKYAYGDERYCPNCGAKMEETE